MGSSFFDTVKNRNAILAPSKTETSNTIIQAIQSSPLRCGSLEIPGVSQVEKGRRTSEKKIASPGKQPRK